MARIEKQTHREIIRHKNELAKLQKENKVHMQQLKKEHKKAIDVEQLSHHMRLNDLNVQQEDQLYNQIQRKDKVLSEIQEKLDKTKELTEKEIQNLKQRHMAKIEQREGDFNIRYHDRVNQRELEAQEEYSRLDERIRDNNAKNAELERDQIINHKTKMRDLHRKGQQEYDRSFQKYKQLHSINERKFAKALHDQRVKQEQLLEDQKRAHLEMMKLHTNRYEDEMHKMIAQHQATKKDTNAQFEVEYKKLMESQRDLIRSLDTRTKGLIKDGKQLLAKEKTTLAAKSADEFYKANQLYPKFIDVGDSYDVFIQIPEHEKNSVQISTQKRDIKISLDRRFDETLNKGPYENTTRKVETITSEFSVPEILDSRTKVKKAYRDGMLIFNIKKA
jgi:hypothetical protein